MGVASERTWTTAAAKQWTYALYMEDLIVTCILDQYNGRGST